MKISRLAIPLLCVLCAGAGFLVGKSGRGNSGTAGLTESVSESGGAAAVPGVVASGSGEKEGEAGVEVAGGKSRRSERFGKLLESRSGRHRAFELTEVFYAMSAEELAAAWPDFEARLDNDPDGWKLLDVFFAAWAAKDVEGAVAGSASLDAWKKSEALGAIAGVIAETDVEAAVEFSRRLEKPDEKTATFNAVLTTVARGSNEAAFALLLRGIDEKLMTGGMWWGASFLTLWANEDPQAAVTHAMKVPDAALRNGGLRSILESWGKSDPEAALRWVDGQEDAMIRGDVLASLVEGWSTRDPEKATAYALSKAQGTEGNDILARAVGKWAEKDLEGARLWVEKIEDPTRRDDARLALIGQLSWRDPKTAAELILEFKDSPRIYSNLEDTTWRWALSDPQGAFDWAMSNIEEADRRGQFLSNLIGGWAENDPKAAAEHLTSIVDPRSRNGAFTGMGYRWAAKDLDGALSWVDSLGDGAEYERALAGVATAYAGKDPLKASEWLQQVPPGAGRDLAVAGFVAQIADKDPAGAWEWGASITEPSRRSQALEAVARTMLQQDRENATTRIRDSQFLSDEIKWRLLDAN